MLPKPARVFDRDDEWRYLADFASRSGGPRLAVVSGRRRQGKTYLVEALTHAAGGLYFGATQATATESLRLFSEALAVHLETPLAQRFENWDEAITYLFSVAGSRPGPIVIDEFPYLSRTSPELPSILQRELDRAVSRDAPIALVLCGSAMSVMGRLLAGDAPLRGRANLELVLGPFDHVTAARFWGVTDHALAVLVHAVVGGTPAYRRFVDGDAPVDREDFDRWVVRTVLSPASPLFREARYLLEEDAVRDSAMYHSVLAAVASGKTTRGAIATYVGRKATDIGHHLNVLEDAGLLRRHPDVFRSSRSMYRVAEPLVNFYQVVMRPRWGLLESGRAENVWADARPRFLAQIVGPHFETLCRAFALQAAVGTFGELPGVVGPGVVFDTARRSQVEIDVAILAPAVPGVPPRVLSLGEAKWGQAIGQRHVDRLRRARDVLAAKGYDTRDTRLTCYAGVGVDPSLDTTARDLQIIGLEDLYAAP